MILEPNFTKEMAEERIAASEHRALKVKQTDPEEVYYFLNLLHDFDQAIRPTVDVNAVVHANNRYTPIQLYEVLLSYLHNCIKKGRNMTINHMAWYARMERERFRDLINGKIEDKNYDFVQDFAAFMTGHIEYRAQDKQNPAFHIFWLKQRGWKDKQEIELSATQGALTAEERAANQRRIANFTEAKFPEALPPGEAAKS